MPRTRILPLPGGTYPPNGKPQVTPGSRILGTYTPSIVVPTLGSAAVSAKDIQTTTDLLVNNGQLPAADAPKPENVLAGTS
jgi:hypothetical protein